MRQLIFGFDVGLGLLLMIMVIIHSNGCSDAQMERARILAGGVSAVVPGVSVAAGSMGWPIWVVLILNVLSSAAGAVVASLPKKDSF